MSNIYTYQTLCNPSEGSYHVSRSKFLAYAFPVDSREGLAEKLSGIKTLHPKAKHHCYAYRILDKDEITEYASDAGEPPGSAGQPILGELRRNHLINVIVIVVRYFGGTKLGIPGLIHAYRESTSQAILSGEHIIVTRTTKFIINMPIALQPKFYSACKQCDVEIDKPEYKDRFTAIVYISMENTEARLVHLLSSIAGREGEFSLLCEWLDVRIEKIEDLIID